ncbi:MerR family transcriptional regulator [Nocardia brevicatena]|uniref:DNA polymerase III subunit beta family protein n=1 Tax=Nocardia brevicatena TaxID=37327 RepID=UPI0002E740D4|nr:MerR family transcriptional regulator [Nocardia brevicatena]
MSGSELITIGAFARSSGLTSSALRFYADSGLLSPAEVDQVSGYRYYAVAQVDRAVTIRRLREIGMPLDAIAQVLDSDAATAADLIDGHVAELAGRAHRARRTAEVVKAALGEPSGWPVATVNGPVFVSAVEQILAATVHEPSLPVLGGVHLEVSPESLTLTATDRYRLSTRTVVPDEPGPIEWAATVDGDDLRFALPEIRRGHFVHLEADTHGVRFRTTDGAAPTCRILSEPFPDHRTLLASLPPARTRVVTSKNTLTRALEVQREPYLRLRVSDGSITVSARCTDGHTRVPAVVTGPDTELTFGFTILHPAVGTALGPDVMIDISDAAHPIVIRSADNGDLTTLAMPADPATIDSENGAHE